LVGTAVLSLTSHYSRSDALEADDSFIPDVDAFLREALDPKLLRRLSFDAADQELLCHVHLALVAVESYRRSPAVRLPPAPGLGGAGRLQLPPDIAQACLQTYNRGVAQLQGAYDVLALSLRRLRLPYTYRTLLSATGYMTWLLLPVDPRVARTRGFGEVLRRPPPQRLGAGPSQVSLEIRGEWNSVGGEDEPSLAYRLYRLNLAALDGVATAEITGEERRRWLSAPSFQDVGREGEAQTGEPPIDRRSWVDPVSGRPVRRRREECESLPELLQHLSLSFRDPHTHAV
jgi:hypothetical protein